MKPYSRLRAMFCRHRDTWAIAYACGCRYEWCACDARRELICPEDARFLGYSQQTVGTWR